MSSLDDLKAATDIDPNVWYHLTEENVDDYDGDFKSMLQTHEGNEFRVFPVANRKTYWQFQPVDKTPGRYALRCSETTTQKQFAVCYRESESVENRRTRACLTDSDGSESQQWDVSLWGKNETYRFINVANGTKYHLDVIPGAAVFMSPNLSGYQKRQRWLMTSVSDVNDDAYSTVFTNPPPESTNAAETTDSSGSASTDSASSSNSDSGSGSGSGSDSGNLSGGAIAGIVIGAILGVLIIALLGFFLWRRNKRKNDGHVKSEEMIGGYNAPIGDYAQSAAYKPPTGATEGIPHGYTSQTPRSPVHELPTAQQPAELSVEQRHELQ